MGGFLTSIIGGILGNNASHDAASAVGTAANQAGQTVNTAAANANTGISTAVGSGQAGVGTAAGNAIAGMGGAVAGAQTGMGTAVTGAQTGVTNAAANAGTAAMYAAGGANGLLNPYIANGTQAANSLSSFMAPGGGGATPFNASMMEAHDPGYQFRLQQGQLALDRSAAARGGAMGGGQLKALTDYAQGAASQEYQAAFNRYTTTQQNTFSNLSSMAGMGANASAQAGGNMMNAAQYAGSTGLAGATYAGNAGIGGATYAGNAGIGGATYAGTAGMNAAQYASTLGLQGAGMQAANTMNAGEYTGNMQLQAGQAKAAGDIGGANAWNAMFSNMDKTASNVLALYGAGF